MQNNSKYTWVVAVLLIIVCLVYFLNKSGRNNSPTEVFTSPEGYEEGTTLSLYEEAPPSFPKGILLENMSLTHSSTLVRPDGKTQVKVAYMSGKPVMDVFNIYKTSLDNAGWRLSVDTPSPQLATISATKKSEKLIITMIAEEAGSSVTFQYEQ